MTQPLFDVLSYSKDLESAGLPRPQADVIAKGMMTMVAQQFESLPSQDHFDAHMSRIDQRFERIDQRFEQIDQQFERIDQRFEQVDQQFERIDQRFEQVDQRFERMDKRLEKQFDAIGARFTNLELLKAHVNIHTWMLGLIIIVLVVPQLQRWFAVV